MLLKPFEHQIIIYLKTSTLNVGLHPIGLMRLTWKVEKFISANVARKKLEMIKAMLSRFAEINSQSFNCI